MWNLIGNLKGPPGDGAPPVVIEQVVPSAEWVIDVGHPIQITVIDSTGRVVEPGTITYSGNQVTLSFSAAFSGKALCFT